MAVKKGKTRPGPPLTTVLRELSDKLNVDDWMRCSTTDDSSFYYIVGMKAHIDEQEGRSDHMSLSIPRRARVAALSEYRVHAQVASAKSSDYYVRQAMSRLASCGVDPDLMKKFVSSESLDLSFLKGHVGGPETEGFWAFADLLQAMVMAKGMDPDESSTEAEKRSELNVAVQKVYLTELSRVYESVVQRAVPLETLTFEDPQLNEASRCYLYGFFRAAVILCASALETNLRKAIGPTGMDRVDQLSRRNGGFFNHLVDEADSQRLLGERVRPGEEPRLVVYSREVFTERTKIVHKGQAPTSGIAEELVTKAREVIEFIRKGPRAGHSSP